MGGRGLGGGGSGVQQTSGFTGQWARVVQDFSVTQSTPQFKLLSDMKNHIVQDLV